MKDLVVCGGGTAGHVMPIIALLPELEKRFKKIHFIGSDGIEKQIAEKNSLPFYCVKSVKFDRRHLLSNVKIPPYLARGTMEARKILEKIAPAAVFSKGGFVSLPTVYAASMIGIPVIIHECDKTLGLANKVSLPFAKKLITSFPDTYQGKKGIFIGNPLRLSVLNGNAANVLRPPLRPNYPKILVMGGSMGALKINECISESLNELLKRYDVMHITGKNFKFPYKTEGYLPVTYTDNIGDYIAAADLVVSRCGASSALELLAAGKKTLFIPLPKGNSRGDQILNAQNYEEENYAFCLRQEMMTPITLIAALDKLSQTSLKPYRYDFTIASRIADVISENAK